MQNIKIAVCSLIKKGNFIFKIIGPNKIVLTFHTMYFPGKVTPKKSRQNNNKKCLCINGTSISARWMNVKV